MISKKEDEHVFLVCVCVFDPMKKEILLVGVQILEFQNVFLFLFFNRKM